MKVKDLIKELADQEMENTVFITDKSNFELYVSKEFEIDDIFSEWRRGVYLVIGAEQ